MRACSRRRGMRGAIDAAVLILIAAALLGGAVGLWIGHGWGKSASAGEVASLSKKNGQLQGDLVVARNTAQANADALTSLKSTQKAELDRRQAIERANQAELAKRAARIAALERDADNRFRNITEKANADEDCAALRTVPVCAAVAERLWGDAATARPH